MTYPSKASAFSITTLAVAIMTANSTHIQAAPKLSASDNSGGSIVSSGNTTNIDISHIQNTNMSWDSFNIANNESVIFNQKNSDSIVVNQINDASASEILGSIEANGHVFLVNNNGFTFGGDAVIDTQGFLATTFNANYDLDTESVILSEAIETIDEEGNPIDANITLKDLDIQNNTQYIAFYSDNINIQGNITDNTTNKDAYISLHTQTSSGEITLPGLPISFTAPDDISSSEQSFTMEQSDTTHGSIQSNNGTILINSQSLADLFTSSINLPSLLSAQSLEFFSNDEISIENEITVSTNSDIKNLSINTTDNIIVDNYIFGTDLSLDMTAKNITISKNEEDPGRSYIGGFGGLKNTILNTISNGQITIEDDLKALDTLKLNGNVDIENSTSSEASISFKANNVNINNIDSLSSTPTNIEISGSNITVGEIKNINDIDIIGENVTLGGTYEFENDFTIKSNNEAFTVINLTETTSFNGESINFDSPIFNIDNNNEVNINFESDDINLSNISMANESNSFDEFNIYYTNSDMDIALGGNIKASSFSINNTTGNLDPSPSINITSDFSITDFNSINIENESINAATYAVSFIGNDNSLVSINDISANTINFENIDTLNIEGNSLNSSKFLNIDADQINLTYLGDETIKLISNSGPITITNSINANNQSIEINSGYGGFAINGITNAESITLSKDLLTDSSIEHSLSGNYQANDFINAEYLGEVTITSNEDNINNTNYFSANNNINLESSQLISTNSIKIQSDNVTLDDITASNITINNGDQINTSTINLYGDLISSNDVTLLANAINLKDDMTIEGNINFLDEKYYTDPENKTGLSYSDTSTTPPTINGNHHLTLNATNDEVYLYEFGDETALASFILNNEGVHDNASNLYVFNLPNISGSRGLSILGNWNWDLGESYSFSSHNQDLNLSGVNLNGAGVVSFNIGTGNLSLRNIGSNGLITDVVIEEAGMLNLYGEIQLVDTEFGYDFSNVREIYLYDDMTFGSIEESMIINFGDATIDGTFDLTIYSNDITIGEIGSNIALQDLNIITSNDLTLNDSVNIVGNANIQANKISILESFTSTGSNINLNAIEDISMSEVSTLNSDYGNITLHSETGNIGLGALTAKGEVLVQSDVGYIFNAIDDYVSNDLTSVNITSNNLTLLGKLNIGQSINSPIVIDIQDNGTINTQSDGNIYIANLADVKIDSDSRVIDVSSKSDTSIIDAYSLFQLSSINSLIEPSYQTTLGLIEHSSWQVDEEENIKTIKTPISSPNLYYSRNGWRLGY